VKDAVRSARPFGLALPLILAAAACSSTSEPSSGTPPTVAPSAPEPRCKTPGALPDGAWFTEVTSEVGLDGIDAIRVTSADLDGDGFPDLVFHMPTSARDSIAQPKKRVFMNRGGKFQETTGESGLLDSRDGSGTGRLEHLVVFADVDNDGDLDMFGGTYIDSSTDKLAAEKDRSEIFLNDGKGHFTLAERSGPSKLALPTSGASFTDIDKDGLVDLFVGTFYQGAEGGGNYLYLGGGDGSFTDVSKASKVLRPATLGDQDKYLKGEYRRPAYGVTVCDADDDGDPDLIVSAYGRGWNELWRNDDGVFTEIAQGTPFAADDIVDYKKDNEFYHCWCSKNADKCTAEESKPRVGCDRFSWTPGFDDQPARQGGNTFTTACADLDNDGDMDFIHAAIKHWHIGDSSDTSSIIRNDLSNGKLAFTRLPNDETTMKREHTIPDWNEGDMDVGAFDVDNDGRKDIWLSSSDYPETWGALFHQKPDGSFENATKASGISHYHAHSFAAVDIDGDGDLDLIVTSSPARCQGDPKCPAKPTIKVYRNEIGSSRNFVKLRLHGKGAGFSNAAAIGAKVTVISGGQKQVQEVGGGYGHFGLQHDTVLTFGLGATCGIDAVEVRWPNKENTVQRFENVVSNYLIDLSEGESAPKYVVR
jgi:enediyne biosynthesis protein E4